MSGRSIFSASSTAWASFCWFTRPEGTIAILPLSPGCPGGRTGGEDEEFGEGEVEQGGEGDGGEIGGEGGQVEAGVEEGHEGEVREDGDEAVGEVEAEEAAPEGAGAAAPGPEDVPGEVVQHRRLDGEGGGGEIVPAEEARREGQDGELDGDAGEAERARAGGAVRRGPPGGRDSRRCGVTSGSPGGRAGGCGRRWSR